MRCPYCERPIGKLSMKCRVCSRYIPRIPHIIFLVLLAIAALAGMILLIDILATMSH